jgi:hypothetical protein
MTKITARATEKAAKPNRRAKGTTADVLPVASKSEPKAKAFATAVEAQGWEVKIETAPGSDAAEDSIEVTATRGVETIWISWTRGSLTTTPMPSYTIADRTIQLRNASAAKQYASRTPDAATSELSKVQSNKAFRPKAKQPKVARLPFDAALATDEEVIEALAGRNVQWVNRHRQESESATILPDRHRITIQTVENGDRIVSFLSVGHGFRAFRLSALERVSGGRPIERVRKAA